MTDFYCITLDSTPERTEHARKQFSREGVNVNWVYGVDAVEFAIKPHLYKNRNGGKTNYISPGECALVLSHYMAFRFAERDGVDDFVIFEDDVILPDYFLDRLERVKANCPKDTLAIWLEWCCLGTDKVYIDAPGLALGRPMCSAAIWYKKEAIPIVLKAIRPAYAQVDVLIKIRAGDQLNPRITYPQLCFQETYTGKMESLVQNHRKMPDDPPMEIE